MVVILEFTYQGRVQDGVLKHSCIPPQPFRHKTFIAGLNDYG